MLRYGSSTDLILSTKLNRNLGRYVGTCRGIMFVFETIGGACGQAAIEAIVGEVVHVGGDGNKLRARNDTRPLLDILSDVCIPGRWC